MLGQGKGSIISQVGVHNPCFPLSGFHGFACPAVVHVGIFFLLSGCYNVQVICFLISHINFLFNFLGQHALASAISQHVE